MASSAPLFSNANSRYAPTEIPSSFVAEAKVTNDQISTSPRRIAIDTLYGDWLESSPIVREAIRLLDEIQVYVRKALETLDNHPIVSDDFINRLVPSLTELFCCRSIGEGFAAASNALLCAVQNHATVKWQRRQLETMFEQVSRLRSEPFVKFDGAIEMVENLEAVGLNPEPQAFDYLADWLDDKSVY